MERDSLFSSQSSQAGGAGRRKTNSGFEIPPCTESKVLFVCVFLPIRNSQGKERGTFYLADRRILKTQEDAMRWITFIALNLKRGER